MVKKDRERLIEYILSFMPLLHKKLFKGIHHKKEMHKMRFLKMISHHNGMPMKFFVERLIISKPNLSKLCDKLVDEGLIDRKNSDQDRRVIHLYITHKGKKIVHELREEVRKDMLKKIEVLSDEEIQKLNNNFSEIESIIEKLE